MVVVSKPLKRMKRRISADLYDFLTFLSPDDMSSNLSASSTLPFRTKIKSFLSEHAMLPPPSSLFPHLLTWQISFRVGDVAEVVCLDIVEEDVARSRSVYCDHCRVVGWSGNPVCTKRYHFIIKSDGNSIGGYHKPCACCGEILHVTESRCKTCFHVTLEDDVEDWVYNQLEDTSHLLHGVVHANGYGHLLRINGREGGSMVLSGCNIMDFWDRLCRTLSVRKISVMDVSKKFGLEYRLLHAVIKGYPWYGDWGYEFGAGSFSLTHDAYKSAVETLSSLSLTSFLPQGQSPSSPLQEKISFYQSLSDRELVNTRDLFSYLISLIHRAHKAPLRSDYFGKRPCISSFGISFQWNQTDIIRTQEAMFRVLRAVSGSQWVSWRALRGAVCKVAPPDLLEHCLDQLGGKSAADGLIVCTRCNPDSGALEYRIEPGKPQLDGITPILDCSAITCPNERILVRDLKFFYEHLLHPLTMQNLALETVRNAAISSASKLLDCKQFMKNYDWEKFSLATDPLGTCLSCEVEFDDDASRLPSELIILPPDAAVSDLKNELSKALQDVYLICRRFQVDELVGFRGVDDSTRLKLLLGTTENVRVRGRCLGKCLGKNGLTKYRMERGIERWTVDCSCGAKDDDGERMLACDVCSVWGHTRCCGIPDSDAVPAKFVCLACRGSAQMQKWGVQMVQA